MGSDIVEITAQASLIKEIWLEKYNDVEDGQMLVRFANGALGTINISRNGDDVYETRCEIVGTEKILRSLRRRNSGLY